MAAFYGSISGNRGTATRMGSPSSGIHASAQSWDGSISAHLYIGHDGATWARIVAGPGSTAYPSGHVVYDGPLAGLVHPTN